MTKTQQKVKRIRDLEKALKEHRKHACSFFEALKQIQMISEEIYGFSYNERDMDEIIDNIDYGGGMTFEHFDKVITQNHDNKTKS